MVVEFGVIGQAYGLGLFLIVAAFRSAVLAVERGSALLAGLAGLLSAAAAGSTLLTAPVAPVLLLWIIFYSPPGQAEANRFIAFCCAAAHPADSASGAFFEIAAGGYFRHLQIPHVLPPVGLAGCDPPRSGGLHFLAEVSAIPDPGDFDRGRALVHRQEKPDGTVQRRGEFYLCGWLALAVGLFISTAHPTFQQYYLFTVPFLSILSALGLSRSRRRWARRGRLAGGGCARPGAPGAGADDLR